MRFKVLESPCRALLPGLGKGQRLQSQTALLKKKPVSGITDWLFCISGLI
jgi:hypothetical protein